MDIDRQIEIAKRKPFTAENLNYIGDLYLKKDDKLRAVAYFFEAADKLRFAQKEKKMAIYKKILNISPVSEKAYIGIIEILSNMGLVMEEKKFLQMLAQLYESRGESARASELLVRINEIGSPVISEGTFSRPDGHKEVMDSNSDRAELGISGNETVNAMSDTEAHVPGLLADMQKEKLIEASLEEIFSGESYPAPVSSKRDLRPWYLVGGGIILSAIAAGAVVYFLAGNQAASVALSHRSVALLPASARVSDYDITISNVDDLTELTGIITKPDMDNTDFLLLTIKSQKNCVPDAFATAPHDMISLLDKKGRAEPIKPVEGLQKSTRTISKMNVCDRDNAIVFVRTIVALDRQNQYSGLAISGLQNTGSLTIRWNTR